MKIDLNKNIMDLNGNVVMDGEKPISCADLVKTSLMTVLESDKSQKADDKLRRFELAMQVNLGGEVDWKTEDVAFVKNRINECFPSPLIVKRCFDILECEK